MPDTLFGAEVSSQHCECGATMTNVSHHMTRHGMTILMCTARFKFHYRKEGECCAKGYCPECRKKEKS